MCRQLQHDESWSLQTRQTCLLFVDTAGDCSNITNVPRAELREDEFQA